MSADALVVLGCRVGATLRGAAARRSERARAAWHEGVAPWVIVSGGRSWDGVCEATALRQSLELGGVRSERILCESRSLSTFENAWFCRPLLRVLGARRIALVTCDFHIARAQRTFERCGLEVIPLPAPSPTRSSTKRIALSLREWASGSLQAPLGGLWDL